MGLEKKMNNEIIRLENLVMDFDGEHVLNNINLSIEDGKFLTLLGPSGCGKSTTLKIIGGFLTPTSGNVYFDGKQINSVPAYKRHINTVFQNYALFPHLDVYDNIAFGLRISKLDEAETDRRVTQMLSVVSLKGFENRSVTSLSGGQQQRVAIARALVNRPRVLLLDEPLGALDLRLRKDMQNELKRIQQEIGITFIYVTHDQEEALTLSDRIAVFNKGYIEQIGTPNEVYNFSQTEFVANFIGDINRLSDTIISGMRLPQDAHHFVRLERVRVNAEDTPDVFTAPGIIQSREYFGLYIKYYIDACGQTIKVIEKNDGISIYEPGESVRISIHSGDIMSYRQ